MAVTANSPNAVSASISICQLRYFFKRSYMIATPASIAGVTLRLMDASEVVVHVMDRKGVLVILNFL